MSDDILQGFLSASVKVFHHIRPLQFITHFSVVIPCSNTWTKKNMNNDQIFWFTVENNLYLNNTCSNGGTLGCYLDQKHCKFEKMTNLINHKFNIKNKKCFFLSTKSAYNNDFWRIMWHWRNSCWEYSFAITTIHKKYIKIENRYFKLLYQYISWY